jgi:hypothetical protein
MRCGIAVALGCAIGGFAGSGTAQAYVVLGPPWPKDEITVHTQAPEYAGSVRRAMRAWNRRDVGIRFRRTLTQPADVVISYGGSPCAGQSVVRHRNLLPSYSYIFLGSGCDSGVATMTAAHELGHVLGLHHEGRRCALMNPVLDSDTGTPNRCRSRSLRYWLRRPVRPDDVRGARSIYR